MGGMQTKGYADSLGQAYGIQGKMTDAQAGAIRNYETLIAKTQLLAKGHGREAAQLVALRRAGVTADSQYGKTVAMLSGHLYDLEQQQNKTERSSSNLVNSLTRRFILGFLTTQIRSLISGLVNLNTELAKTGDIATRAGMGSGAFQGAQAAASNKGIDSGKFADDMLKFGQGVERARSGLGELGALLRANGITVRDTEDAFGKVADLVMNAANESAKFSILQQAGLPATREMVRFMEQGRDAIKSQGDEAKKFTAQQLQGAQELEDKWHKLWTNFTRWGKGAILETFDTSNWSVKIMPGSPIDRVLRFFESKKNAQISLSDTGDISGFGDQVRGHSNLSATPTIPVTRGPDLAAPKPAAVTVDPAKQRELLGIEQQRLAILGQTASVADVVRQKEIEITLARMNGVSVSTAQAEALKRIAAEQTLGITQMRASTDALRIEAETIGMSTGQAASYLAVQTRINEARREGRELTPANIEAIRAEGNALGEAAQRADNMRWGYENLVRGPLQTFRTTLMETRNGWEALRASGLSALESISAKLMDMAAKNLFMAAFGGGAGMGGGGAGILSLFGVGVNHTGYGPGDSMPHRMVSPAAFVGAPRFHSGIGPGERAAVIRNDESVLTPGQMKALGNGAGGGINVTVNQENHFVNADPNSEARMREWARQTKDAAVGEAVQKVAEIKAGNPAYMRGGR